MKIKQLIATATLLSCATLVHAQAAGDFILSTGWSSFIPRGGIDSLGEKFDLQGRDNGPIEHNPLAEEGVKLADVDALNVSGTYFVTDHLAGEIALTMPGRIDLQGTNQLDTKGKVGSLHYKSIALLLKYYFFDAEQKFRPYVGLGVSRAFFSATKLNTEPLLGIETDSEFSVKNEWAPVFTGGFTYRFKQHWFAGFSVSYMPLRTTAKLRIPLRDSPINIVSESTLKLNPIIPSLNIGFRF